MKRHASLTAVGALLAVCAALLVLTPTAGAVGGFPAKGHWHPAPRTAAWQWQLQGAFRLTPGASVYDIDGFEAAPADVRAIHRHRDKAICYLDVGSWEEYRPDASRFPGSVLGRRYEGFPEERWLDIAHFGRFAPIIERRIEMCARKRFDAVEPDNIAGWENKTGFPLSRAEQLRYDRWIAAQVHRRGMAVALKNDPRQARQLVRDFDFAIVEECFQYDECGFYRPFVAAGKAVFEAEYELPTSRFCARAEALDFAAIRKDVELFSRPWEPCDPLPRGTG
ncbi:MAG TPA: endo alpha-1,4 polygalactosaminidase [Solirubrobacterales bacterium]|nr:endo alpha-1,4 polygalactosaminidase [Solirubrobacterales bacterium]